MEARARRERKERRLKQEKEEAIRMKQSLWEQERQKQERTLVRSRIFLSTTIYRHSHMPTVTQNQSGSQGSIETNC